MAVAQTVYGSQSTMTITLNSLANTAGRVGTQIDFTDGGNKAPQAIKVHIRFRTGSVAPTAGKTVQFYWATGDENGTAHVDGGLATTDTSYTTASTPRSDYVRDQLQFAYAQPVQAGTATDYYVSFVVYSPGPRGSLFVYNDIGQTLDSTSGNFYVRYETLNVDVA
ncbi:MAG: hypothetical protein EOP06_00550 [Proteobacteria bacterium]|nr:MAG: hypothetical protein EOP06_00550 [Pseudomonadota bacterium]